MADSTEIRSLHRKLAAVAAEVGRIEKRGYNSFHKYHYALEADIVEAVRTQLAAGCVTLLPSLESVVREGDLTTVVVVFTFTDGDSGEMASIRWAGCGSDKGDKGIYKAFTGALKYALMKTFLIATGDDPEGDTATDKRTAPKAAAPAKPKPEDPAVVEGMTARTKLAALARGNGLTKMADLLSLVNRLRTRDGMALVSALEALAGQDWIDALTSLQVNGWPQGYEKAAP